MDGCSISFCGRNGVWLQDRSNGEVKNSDIRRCDYDGIALSGPGSLRVIESTCVLNKNAGLASIGQGDLRARGCIFQDNDVLGVVAQDGGILELEKCLVSWNRRTGICVNSGSRVNVSNCTLYANRKKAASSEDGAVLTIRRSILMGEGPHSYSCGIVAGDEQESGIVLDTNDVFYFRWPYVGVSPDKKSFAAAVISVSRLWKWAGPAFRVEEYEKAAADLEE